MSLEKIQNNVMDVNSLFKDSFKGLFQELMEEESDIEIQRCVIPYVAQFFLIFQLQVPKEIIAYDKGVG